MSRSEQQGVIRIGTSGIVVPTGGKESYPVEFQQSSRLNYYSSLFNTLEINSSFRKVPQASTFTKWSLDVGEEFVFTVKFWKEITHIKRLQTDLDKIDVFLEAAKNLGDKKGCLLIQFPASISAEFSHEVKLILQRVNQADRENEWKKAVEFRSATWYNGATQKLLKHFKASLVLHDMPKSGNLDMYDESHFCYVRFHGPTGDYRGSYSNEFLKEEAAKIRNQLQKGRDVFVYFNNTMGDAFNNAITLRSMLED